MSSRRAWTGITGALLVAACVWWLAGGRAAPMPAARGPLTVRVLLDDGTLAVGAEVRVGPVWDRFELADPTPEANWATFTTNAEATASVPWPPTALGRVPIAAHHGAQWGRIDVPSSTRPGLLQTIQLQRDQTFVVRVVDGEGKPAPAVGVWLHGPPQQLHPEAIVRIEQGRTAGNGEVRFEHAQQWIADIEERDGVRPLTVSTSGLAAAPALELDANHLPAEPVTLQLAAFGCIEVTTVEADGKPMTRGLLIVQADDDRVWGERPNDSGITTCPVVALGQACRAWIPVGTGEPFRFAGPTRAGETVAITLRGEPSTLLTGRLVHHGAPVRNARVQVTVDDFGLPASTATTDDEGWFRVHGRNPTTARNELTIETIGARRRPTGLRAVLRATPTSTGELDLGTIAMARDEELPLLVAGRIETSAHLESVQVTAVRTERSRPFDLDPPPVTAIRSDGSFEVRGGAVGESLQLKVLSGRHQHVIAIPFARGERHLHVALEPQYECKVTANFAVPSREVAMALRPVLRDAAAGRDSAPEGRTFDGRLLTCHWETAAGTYELQVHGQAGPWLLKIPNIVVGKGTRQDARLQHIDLPDLHPWHLRVPVARESEDVDYLPTEIRLLDGDEERDDAAQLDEHTFLVLADAPVDLRVRVAGYRERVLRGVAADTDIELQPGIPVTLQCTLHDLPAGSRANLDLSGAGYLSIRAGDGPTNLLLPAAGNYDLSGTIWNSDGPIAVQCEPDTMVVGENGGGFQVTVRPK